MILSLKKEEIDFLVYAMGELNANEDLEEYAKLEKSILKKAEAAKMKDSFKRVTRELNQKIRFE